MFLRLCLPSQGRWDGNNGDGGRAAWSRLMFAGSLSHTHTHHTHIQTTSGVCAEGELAKQSCSPPKCSIDYAGGRGAQALSLSLGLIHHLNLIVHKDFYILSQAQTRTHTTALVIHPLIPVPAHPFQFSDLAKKKPWAEGAKSCSRISNYYYPLSLSPKEIMASSSFPVPTHSLSASVSLGIINFHFDYLLHFFIPSSSLPSS